MMPHLGAVDVTSQDTGGIIHLEHINLEVPDLELARLFYAEGLGLTVDPATIGNERGRPQVVWYNIGRQQFHIAKRGIQRTPGYVEIVLPSLDALEDQLEGIQPLMAGTDFWFERTIDKSDGVNEILIRDPWGQRFSAREASQDFPFRMGIAGLNLPCRLGHSHDIGAFYKAVFNARVNYIDGEICIVHVGPGSRLIFVEDSDVADYHAGYEGWHLAIYISNFSAAFQGIEAAGLLVTDHEFRDVSHNIEAALDNMQFRFQDIVALPGASNGASSNGSLPARTQLYRFQHEVRSLHHPRFLKPLFNRALGGFDY